MAHPTVTYQVYIEHTQDNITEMRCVEVDVVLDQKSKSKAKNRSRAATMVKEMFPGCKVNQILYS